MRRSHLISILSVIAVTVACMAPREAPRVHLAVKSDPDAIEANTNAEGYEITLSEARMVLSDFQFTTAGEVHAKSLFHEGWDLVVPSAWAHPGHYQGGEVIGDLDGRFVVNLLERESLGTGEFITDDYEAANFTFDVATKADVPDKDELVGHTALFRGTATKDDVELEFTILLDAPDGRELVGAPFPFTIEEDTQETVGFRFLPTDPYENDTFFDGIDFASLHAEDDGVVVISPDSAAGPDQDAYVLLRRTFMTHDHYQFTFEP